MKRAMYIALLTCLIVPATTFAEVFGRYGVSGKLLQPEFKQCFFDLEVKLEGNQISLSKFSCGRAEFPAINAVYDKGILRDAAGALIGNVTGDTLVFQGGGNTVRLTLTSPNAGGLTFSGGGLMIRGELTRK